MGDLIRQQIPATGQIVADGGQFFKLIESSSPVDVIFDEGGATKKASQVEAGYQRGPLPIERRFNRVKITGTPGQTIAALVGDDYEDYDRVIGLFQQQTSSATQAPTADVNVGGSAVAVQLVAAGSRYKVTVGLLDTALTSVRVGPAGTIAANRGARLTPGQSYTYEGTGALHAIREAAAAALMWVLEEV